VRGFTRPQNLLRAFFGLGPEQFSLEDVIFPTIDVDHLMRSSSDTTILQNATAATAPGASANVSLALPADGAWLIHAVSVQSAGPATSGSFRMSANFGLDEDNWDVVGGANIGIFDNFDLWARVGGVVVSKAKWFDKPPVLYSRGGDSDLINGHILNDAASVGNAVLTLMVMARQLERV